MPDPHPGASARHKGDKHATSDKRNLFQRIVEFVHPGPDSTDQLISTLADAEDKELIAPESRMMLEGVIRMADMIAGDVMVAAPRMDMLDIDAPYEDILHVVIDTGHSRFPVYERERENIIGILLAKDLLKLQRSPELNLRTLLRPAVFVPESKGLNELLRDFRSTATTSRWWSTSSAARQASSRSRTCSRRSSARSRTSSTTRTARAAFTPWPTAASGSPATPTFKQ